MQPYVIEVKAIEWLYVLKGLLKGYTTNVDFTIASTAEGFALYTIPRHLVSTEAMAKATGASEAAISTAAKIILTPITGTKEWQKPTVDYWGEA